MTITIKERIQRDLKPTCSEPVQGSNHVTRRHFRLWIEGSYLGDDHGKGNKKALIALMEKWGICTGLDVAFEKWAVREFITFTAYEYGCSWGYAQKCIADFFKDDPHGLAMLNICLGYDAAWLIEDELEDFRRSWNAEVLGA